MQADVFREARGLQFGLCPHLQLTFMYASWRIQGGNISTIWSLSSSTTKLCMQADVSREARGLQFGLCPHLQLSFMYASWRIQGGKISTIWSLSSSTTKLCMAADVSREVRGLQLSLFVLIYNYPLCMQADVFREARGQFGLCPHLQLSFMYASWRIQGGKISTIWSLSSSTTKLCMQADVFWEARGLQFGLCPHLQLSFMYASWRIQGGKRSTIWSLSSSTTIHYVCKLTYSGRQEVYNLVFVLIYNYPLCMQADVSREARGLQFGLCPHLQLSIMYASWRIQGGKRSTIWSESSWTTILY